MLKNAYFPIEVTELGMVMLVMPVSLNAPSPIEVNDEGEANVTLVRFLL